MEGEEKLGDLQSMLKDSLRNQRYLIVLDDVWNTGILDYLIKLFPHNNNGSQVLVTTRLQHVVKPRARGSSSCTIRLLNPKESWNLLREKVFGEMQCPPQLEKAGKEIAEKCEGLPLTIVTVAHILYKADKTTEYWNEVASAKQHSVFMDAYERMCKERYPSYDYLDQHLKACFLYMGAFPQTCWIRSSDLFNLWSAEGLPDSDEQFRERTSYPHVDMTLTDATTCCLLELNSKNVFLSESGVNFVRLYSPFWYLCNKEAAKNKFFYGLNTRADGLAEESLKVQRRLCIRNSILFSMEDVHNLMASVSNVRSLLCTGPDHQYPVPICLGLRLLRVLDALRIRLYEFPVQLLDLIQLRYLALTYQGNLPPTISKLWNLQFFIVSQYLSIISDMNSSYLPMQIWDMKELKYLQVTGSNLPHPSEGSLLPNLLTLRGVSAQSCTKHNFERIPNLEELKVQIELAPDVMEPLRCLDHISHLNKLKVLRCTIVNPIFKTEVAAPLAPLAVLPSTLVRISLSGLGYPWEEIRKISSLPNLITLMLYDYAFRGPKWEVGPKEFRKLRTLKVQDTDLVQWTFRHNLCLSAIESITIGHCYKLKKIPLKFGKFLKSVDLVDCNPRAVTCAKMSKMLWKQEYPLNPSLHLNVHPS